jgi:hypothetical protein
MRKNNMASSLTLYFRDRDSDLRKQLEKSCPPELPLIEHLRNLLKLGHIEFHKKKGKK